MYMLAIPLKDIRAALKSKTQSLKPQVIKLHINFDKGQVQKNWMPFIKNKELMCVYSVNPHIILRINTENGKCNVVSKIEYPELPKNLRGSSNIIKQGNVWMGVLHIRIKPFAYVSAIYIFDNKFRIKKISDYFVFNENSSPGVEFVSGLEYNDKDKRFYIAYGYWDCEAKIAVVKKDQIDKMIA